MLTYHVSTCQYSQYSAERMGAKRTINASLEATGAVLYAFEERVGVQDVAAKRLRLFWPLMFTFRGHCKLQEKVDGKYFGTLSWCSTTTSSSRDRVTTR